MLIEQDGYAQALRLVSQQKPFQKRERQAGVEDVLDKNDILATKRLINILGEPNFASRIPRKLLLWPANRTAAITGDAYEFKRRVELHCADQIAQENCSTFQHAHKNRRLPAGVASDLMSQLGD